MAQDKILEVLWPETYVNPDGAGELLFLPRFLRIPRPATILRCPRRALGNSGRTHFDPAIVHGWTAGRGRNCDCGPAEVDAALGYPYISERLWRRGDRRDGASPFEGRAIGYSDTIMNWKCFLLVCKLLKNWRREWDS
jgi:hypothetical protein